MKKSAFACLAVFTMSLAVSAASADDYVTLAELGRQAADGWHQTYQANGREIVADAETVFYPTGEQCPIVQVEGLGKDENDSVFDVHRQKKNSSIYAFDMSLSVDVLDDDSVNYVPWQELGKGKLYQEQTFFYHGEEPNIAAENVDLTYPEFKKHVDEELNRTLGLTLEQFYQYRVWVSQPAYRAVMVDGQKTPGNCCKRWAVTFWRTFRTSTVFRCWTARFTKDRTEVLCMLTAAERTITSRFRVPRRLASSRRMCRCSRLTR